MSPLTAVTPPRCITPSLPPQHHPACPPVSPATAPVSPLSPHIPPTPTGPCTTTPPLPSYFSSPHHRAPDWPLIPTYLSSIRLLSGKPAPACSWCASCPVMHNMPSTQPGTILAPQEEGERNKAKHSFICDNRTWQRLLYYTVLQEKQKKKTTTKAKSITFIHISNLPSLPTRALR